MSDIVSFILLEVWALFWDAVIRKLLFFRRMHLLFVRWDQHSLWPRAGLDTLPSQYSCAYSAQWPPIIRFPDSGYGECELFPLLCKGWELSPLCFYCGSFPWPGCSLHMHALISISCSLQGNLPQPTPFWFSNLYIAITLTVLNSQLSNHLRVITGLCLGFSFLHVCLETLFKQEAEAVVGFPHLFMLSVLTLLHSMLFSVWKLRCHIFCPFF